MGCKAVSTYLALIVATSSIINAEISPVVAAVDVLGDLAPITGSSADSPTTPTCPSAAVERFCGRDLAMDNAAYLAVKRGGCTPDNGQYSCPGGYVLDARTFFAANTTACQAACSADGASLGLAQDYQWTVSDWGPCPVRCGGALQSRRVACATIATSELVPDWYCPLETQPVAQQSCGDAPCAALGGAAGVVQLEPWGECIQGIEARSARCVGAAMGVPVGVQACTADGAAAIKLGTVFGPLYICKHNECRHAGKALHCRQHLLLAHLEPRRLDLVQCAVWWRHAHPHCAVPCPQQPGAAARSMLHHTPPTIDKPLQHRTLHCIHVPRDPLDPLQHTLRWRHTQPNSRVCRPHGRRFLRLPRPPPPRTAALQRGTLCRGVWPLLRQGAVCGRDLPL